MTIVGLPLETFIVVAGLPAAIAVLLALWAVLKKEVE